MIFYLFFGFWEIVLRFILTIIVYGLGIIRLLFLFSIPIFILILCTIIVAKIAFRLTNVKCDENRSVDEIVTTRGFHLETHKVTTPDGYILTLHRIVNSHVDAKARISKPILLMHGMGMHSLIYLLNEERGGNFRKLIDPKDPSYSPEESKQVEDSLGFELAKRGFDVWLGNQRGNRFCQAHATLHPVKDAAKFWDFSFDEIASFDLPTTIDYILAETGQSSLSYVGISQGATVMFALLASNRRFNDIIKPFVAIAPVVKTTHSRFVQGFGSFIQNWAPTLAYYFPGSAFPSFIEFCVQLFFCNHSLESFTNSIGTSLYKGKYINKKRVSSFLAYPGVHVSRKNACHYLQLAKNDFCKFDYGARKNRKIYGSKTPPKYDLSSITNDSIAIIYAVDDSMASAQDIRHLRNQLSVPPLDVYAVKKKKFDHQDFQLSKGCGSIVNSRILILLKATLTSSPTPQSDLSRSSCGSIEDLYDSLEDRHHSRQNNNEQDTNEEFEREGDKSRSTSASSSTTTSFEVVDIGENGNGSDQGKNDNYDDSVLRKRK